MLATTNGYNHERQIDHAREFHFAASLHVKQVPGSQRTTQNKQRIKKQSHLTRRAIALSSIAITAFALASFGTVSAEEQPIPKPDGKPTDMSKPVQVFILLGQSNMVGMGEIAGGEGSLEHAVKTKNR